ncbi:Lnb N-terminal periplasmic domain-containing protein [Alishewanella longhuensis]
MILPSRVPQNQSLKAHPIIIVLILPWLLLSAMTQAKPAADPVELAKQPYWLKLGHYLPTYRRGYRSTIDSKSFFLATDGKTNPLAELNATLELLYHSDPAIAEQARCTYPARYTWLELQAGNTASLNCSELDEWRAILDPAGMTLVFPTAFMNNPSSMFGHTLLRVDAKDQSRHQELVAFAINFAAEPAGNDNPVLYAAKGLLGAYPGRFSVMPYYRKVREYNDMESRDIWEYPLKLSEPEVERVLLHLWEMQQAEFDYYFLDENCSYQLLALLELARDDLFLVKDFPLQAIPSDTVATLAKQGLLDNPRYRESFGTRLLHISQQVSPELFAAAEVAKQGLLPEPANFSDEELTIIYEFAYEWLNFELYDQGLARDPTAKTLTTLLRLRSQIDTPSPFKPVPKPAFPPEQGHGSARVGLSGQYWQDTPSALNIEWRAAYHDLLDAPEGFIAGAQISFLDLRLSHNEHNTTRLEQLYLLDAMTIPPSQPVFSSLSWNLRVGYDRQPAEQKREGRWFAQGGYGQAWGDAAGLHSYALLAVALNHGQATAYRFSPGAGVEAGILWQAASKHRLALQGQYLALFNHDASYQSQINLSWNWSLAANWAIRSELRYQHWQQEDFGAKVTGYFYF